MTKESADTHTAHSELTQTLECPEVQKRGAVRSLFITPTLITAPIWGTLLAVLLLPRQSGGILPMVIMLLIAGVVGIFRSLRPVAAFFVTLIYLFCACMAAVPRSVDGCWAGVAVWDQ